MSEEFKYLVLKIEDLHKYCSDEQLKQLNNILDAYNNAREVYDKKPINKYYVVNRDEYPQFLDNPEIFKEFLDVQVNKLDVYFVNQETEYCGTNDEYIALVKDHDFENFVNIANQEAYEHLAEMEIKDLILEDNFDGRDFDELDEDEQSYYYNLEDSNLRHDINRINHENPEEVKDFKLYEIKYISI